MSILAFTPLCRHPKGTLASLLVRSYAEIVAAEPQYWGAERQNWEQFDREAFGSPDTVGACVFVTCLEREPIGLGSYDPRQAPELGLVGHNCVLPEFRGRGFGKRQVREILRRLRRKGMRRARVSTGEQPFFAPARKMYAACGFRETSRLRGRPDPRHGQIEYERTL